uniref:Uncharacterized protein AlNc14C33G3024 n=1 Tax=Albugo laibachii Nc14 TaxID=890382 RepID=F0W847_9STRA|nr:conserved hypothetical protein [Albugo laibachii Nc14]|eukprot:CCA17330.1 conserved hypothetical protein [Albugo laibachii Nc14]
MPNTESMKSVREKHVELHQVIGTLSDKIGALLGKQERDFLAAYRAHMFNVQKELHELRNQLQRTGTDESKTEKEKKLEEERDYFRKEALRLDEITSSISRDLQHVKDNLATTEKDRDWIAKQLKKYKKQNKLLNEALDSRTASADYVDSQNITPLRSGSHHCTCFAPRKCDKGAKSRKGTNIQRSDTHITLKAEAGKIHGVTELCHAKKVSRGVALLRLNEQSDDKASNHQSRNGSPEQQTIENNDFLSKGAVLEKPEPSLRNLRKFYLQCLLCVKEGAEKGDTASLIAETKKKINVFKDDSEAVDFPEVQDFSVSDRVRVIEQLLANDEVLFHLHNFCLASRDTTKIVGNAPVSLMTQNLARKAVYTRSGGKSAGVARQPAGSGASVVAARNHGLPLNASLRSYLNMK